MLSFYYNIKNKLMKRKPYFDKIKYLSDRTSSAEDRADNLLDILSEESKWFDELDGKELKQISKFLFVTKGKPKMIIATPNWIRWEEE